MEGVFADDRGCRVRTGFAVPAQSIYVTVSSRGSMRDLMRRYAPMEPSGRTRSTTIPMVFAKRTGLCGVFAGRK